MDKFPVKAGDVINPSVVKVTTSAFRANTLVPVSAATLSLYTGMLPTNVQDKNDQTPYRVQIVSYLLESKLLVHVYTGPADIIAVDITGSISSFGDRPSVCALDSISIALEDQLFLDHSTRKVLVIRANAAVQGGSIHGVSYQVNLTSVSIRTPPASCSKSDEPGLRVS